MLRIRLTIFGALCVSALALTGCGTTGSMTGTPSGNNSNLAGNWLLAGQLPPSPVGGLGGSFNGTPPAPGLAANFDVIGTNVVGDVSLAFVCPSGQFTFSTTTQSIVTGAIAADGTFALTTPTVTGGITAPVTVTIKGTVPSTANGPWSGTYTYALNPAGSSCSSAVTASSNIAAISIPLLNGTYTGSATPFFSSGPTVTFTTLLKQGGSLIGGTGTSVLPLAGTVSVTGSSCLTSGTAANSASLLGSGMTLPGISGAVEGNTVLALYQMNDNSLLAFEGAISAVDATKLTGAFVTLQPGSCNTNYISSSTTLTLK